jgi:hypothetical protein
MDSYFQPVRSNKNRSRMTTDEAQNHTKTTVEARKKILNKRAAKKIALRQAALAATMESSDIPSSNQSTPNDKRECTRQRSPSGTPNNDVKLQRTGKAPLAPSTQDKIARTLE